MHDLLYTLQDHDIGHLRIIAEFWGFDLPTTKALDAANWLARSMLDTNNLLEIIESLPELARHPLDTLILRDGRAAFADMVHQFGPIREMGMGRRDRQKPWRDPLSGLEILWYRGLIARSFTDASGGLQEYLFIPTNLLQLLPKPNLPSDSLPGRESLAPHYFKATSTQLVDDLTSLLAFLRRDPERTEELDVTRQNDLTPFLHHSGSLNLIFKLLRDIGVLSSPPVQPLPAPTRDIFDAPSTKIYATMLHAWKASTSWNDLKQLDGIGFHEEEWPNDPISSRHAILDFLSLVPIGKWWDINSFTNHIKERKPGFLRPAGDFDSWYLQSDDTGEILRGFGYWDQIEGGLIRYIITHPLYFLGAADLGGLNEDRMDLSFRLTPGFKLLIDDQVEPTVESDAAPIQVFPDGRVLALHNSSQAHRYQVARFCDWIKLDNKGYHYRISPSALRRASDQGLDLSQIQILLESVNQDELHPSLKGAIARWRESGKEAYIEHTLVLKLKNKEVMDTIQSNPSTARYLHEILGPTTASIKEKDIADLCTSASRLGILIDTPVGT